MISGNDIVASTIRPSHLSPEVYEHIKRVVRQMRDEAMEPMTFELRVTNKLGDVFTKRGVVEYWEIENHIQTKEIGGWVTGHPTGKFRIVIDGKEAEPQS